MFTWRTSGSYFTDNWRFSCGLVKFSAGFFPFFRSKMALTNIQRILVRVPFALHASSKRHIASKALQATLGPRPSKPPPFPYMEKDYTLLHSMFDKTTKRFDENTKLIVIEGPVGIGKRAHRDAVCSLCTYTFLWTLRHAIIIIRLSLGLQ